MRKTIVQVFGSLDAGGAESRMMDVFRTIDRNKYTFVFISLDSKDNQFYESEILSLGGRIIKISSPRDVGIYRHLKEMIKMFKNLKSSGANVVHSHTSYHSGLVLLAARIAGISVRIAHARTTSSANKGSIVQKFMIEVGKYLIKINATHKLALNDETAIALYGQKADNLNIKILPNAIDLERYRTASTAEDLQDISSDCIVIGHIGRFQPMKNHKFLVDFFKEFNKKYKNSVLVLVGDGPIKEEIEQQVKNYGLNENVRFLGLRKDIADILKRVNIFVLPSYFEGLCGSVLEAQASAIPCLISNKVSTSVDMGLNLVKFLSLTENIAKWVTDAELSLNTKKPSFESIFSAFSQKGFTLESEIKKLTAIYENSHNNNHDI